MLSGGVRIVALAFVAAGLAGCASDRAAYVEGPYGESRGTPAPDLARAAPTQVPQQTPLQCVPYAREHSAVKLYGDAWTWWAKADGKFSRESVPESGAVLVLTDYAGPERGHVAVVRSLISSREIHIDHANWLGDGAIYLDDPVADVSADNDWSQVRVWNIKTGGWGARIYPVQGFIGPGSASVPGGREAPRTDPDLGQIALADPGASDDPARVARAELGIIQ
jgi:hypothetical protein